MATRKTEVAAKSGELSLAVDATVVYPSQGVGRITAIEKQTVAGMDIEMVVVTIPQENGGKSLVKIPSAKAGSILRPLSTPERLDKALVLMAGKPKPGKGMWSRRSQEYDAKIRSGDLMAMAEVARDLYRPESDTDMSYSQRQLVEDALKRLAAEFAAVRQVTDQQARAMLVANFAEPASKGGRKSGDDEVEEAA